MQHAPSYHAPSYYAASANKYAAYPNAHGDKRYDVCVIGAGFTGLSTALHLAERGYKVIVLEASSIGWGASGRNGGQLIPGLRKSASDLVAMFGTEAAKRAFDISLQAIEMVSTRIKKHNIACDYKPSGHFHAAAKVSHINWMADEIDCLHSVMHYEDAELIAQKDVLNFVQNERYFGGVLDKRGGHIHPLNYAIGLAQAASSAGVDIFENSAVISLDHKNTSVKTATSNITANFIVIACDAYLGTLDNELGKRIMPVANYGIATEPLAADIAARLIPQDMPISDSKFVLDYYRLSADKRLLFSGGEKYTTTPPADIAAFVKPFLHRTFPQLKQTKIDYAWGGMVSVTTTRLPDIGRRGNVFHAQGYSGQGVALTTLAGAVLAEAIAGTAERFDVLGSLRPPAFPGGTILRTPAYLIGMLYFALRDRL
jgi:gamma-glutamylputrescine oxidase